MGSLGFPEIVVILALALILFGPKRLPEIGRMLGSTLREFKKATREFTDSLEHVGDEDERSSYKKAGDQ